MVECDVAAQVRANLCPGQICDPGWTEGNSNLTVILCIQFWWKRTQERNTFWL